MRRIGMRVNWSHLGRGLRAMVAAGTLWAAWAGCQNTMDPQVGELWQRQALPKIHAYYGEALEGFSINDIVHSLHYLLKMLENMEKIDAADGPDEE